MAHLSGMWLCGVRAVAMLALTVWAHQRRSLPSGHNSPGLVNPLILGALGLPAMGVGPASRVLVKRLRDTRGELGRAGRWGRIVSSCAWAPAASKSHGR